MRSAIGVWSLALGAAAAGLGLWLGQSAPGSSAVPPATSPVVVAPRAAPVSLGPTRLIPVSLRLDGRELAFSYQLVDEAPAAGATIFFDPDVPVVAPERWTLRTAAGPIEGVTATVRATTARFRVPDGFTLDEVDGLTLESYRIRLPLVHTVELAWDDTDPIAIDAGIAVSVRRILEQTSSTLVQLVVDAPVDNFSSAGGGFGAAFEAAPRVGGVGRGWTNVGPVTGGVQLTFVGDRLADPFMIEVVSNVWTEIARPVTIGVGGLADG